MSPIDSASSPAAAISGSVRDPGGAPIADARVFFVSGPVALPEIAALTDGAGRFVLSAPAAGTYELGIAADGFINASVKATVPLPSDLEVTLDPAP